MDNGASSYRRYLDGDDNALAEFMFNGVGFRIVAEGLTQEELVAVVVSLLD